MSRHTYRYMVVDEWAQPVFFGHQSTSTWHEASKMTLRAYWVVKVDEDSLEIVEWVAEYPPEQEEQALALAKGLSLLHR